MALLKAISHSSMLGQWETDSVFPVQDPSEFKDSTLSEDEYDLIGKKYVKKKVGATQYLCVCRFFCIRGWEPVCVFSVTGFN